jgi:hypothetical protein
MGLKFQKTLSNLSKIKSANANQVIVAGTLMGLEIGSRKQFTR